MHPLAILLLVPLTVLAFRALTHPLLQTSRKRASVIEMSVFNPRSYIAEAVALSKSASPPTSFVPSYYDFTTGALRKKEKSESIAKVLRDEYEKRDRFTAAILGVDLTIYHRGDKDDLHERLQMILARLEAEVPTKLEAYTQETLRSLKSVGSELRSSGMLDGDPSIADIRTAAIVDALCQDLDRESDLLLEIGDWHVAFQGEPWTVGVRGVDRDATEEGRVYITQETLGAAADARAMLLVNLSDQFERGVSVRVSFLGERVSHLLCYALIVKRCCDYASLLTFLRTVAGAPSTLTNFYCDGNDGFDLCLDAVLEDAEGTSRGANVWNMKQYFLETVRAGNAADTAHLLQTKHNGGLFAVCKELMRRLPRIKATFTVTTADQKAELSETFDSFHFLNRWCDSGCLAVPQCSSVYNYLLEPGQMVSMCFTAVGEPGAPTLRRLSGGGGEAGPGDGEPADFLFTVKGSYLTGDCALVIGSVTAVHDGKARIPVLLPSSSTHWMEQEFISSPFLATLMHRQFGHVGFSGYGVAVASNFPPSLALIAPHHYSEFPLEDGAVDPNVTIYFANGDSPGPLNDKSFSELYDRLPVQLSSKGPLPDEHLSVKISARLLRIIPHKEGQSVIALAAVTGISFFAPTVFLHYDHLR